MHVHKMVIFSLLFSFSLHSMDAPISLPLPKEVIHHSMAQSNLQSIGRFGQTSHENNKWYQNYVVCKDPHDDKCTSLMCRTLSNYDWFDNGTQALVVYAKEYEKNHNNQYALDMFKHLWRHHDAIRMGAMKNVCCYKQDITGSDCIKIYAGKYAQKELGNLLHMNTELANRMKCAMAKENSLKLKRFLMAEAIYSVKTMLLADNLLFDPEWSGHKHGRDRDKYRFGDKKRDSIVDCACVLGDITIINHLVKISRCFHATITSMMYYYKIDLLDAFIKKNLRTAINNRFFIWKYALEERHILKSGPFFSQELQFKVFEKIIALLFPGEINAQDEYETLLHKAISEKNALGVKFLLEQGADPHIKDWCKFTPLYHAYENPVMVSCLIAHGVDVNQRNKFGRTALMAAGSYRSYHENVRKVFELLLQAGADVDAVDKDGKSVLHYYTTEVGAFSDSNSAEIISLFIKYGANTNIMDHAGKTPFDYAQENGKKQTMELLCIVEEVDNDAIEYSSVANPFIE